MPRKNKENADRQPLEINELKKIVSEFMDRYDRTENELQLLKEDQLNLIEEFSDRLDMKTLKQAIRAVKLQKKVNHKDTFESFFDILSERESV